MKTLKLYLLACTAFCSSLCAQTTIYSTDFGTATCADPTGWSVTAGQEIAIDNSQPSDTYTGASGDCGYKFCNDCVGASITQELTLSGQVSTVGYTNITVIWGARLSGSSFPAITVEWSDNGTLWNNIAFSQVSANSTWALVNGGVAISLPVSAENVANLRFKFSYLDDFAGDTYFIDDFKVEGCEEPTTDASSSAAASITASQFNLSWTNGDGSDRIVLVKQGSAVDANPADASSYTANAAFTSGSQIGTGNYVVYSGTGSNVTITGLIAGTDYYWAIYEFNDCNPDYKTDAPETGNTTTCETPSTAPSADATSAVGATSFQLDWTAGDGDRRIVLLKEGSAVDASPSSNTAYSANPAFGSGDELGTDNFVIYSGTGTSVTITGLSPGTDYYWEIFEFNDCGPTYKTDVTETGNETTLCPEPTTAPSLSSASGILGTQFQIDFTAGDGSNRLVVLKEGSAVAATPSDAASLTANAAFGSGTDIGTGEYVVYSGTGTSVTVTGLSMSTTYHWAIFEFNDCEPDFKTDAFEIGNATTICDEPTTQTSASAAGSITTGQFQLSWTDGAGTNRIVLIKQGSAVDAPPSDATAQTANAAFGSGDQLGTGNYVVYNGTGSNVTITGLSSGTTYHWAIFEFNDCEPDYKTDVSETGNTTTCSVPTTAPSASSASGVAETQFQLDWTAGDGDNRIVVLKQGSAVTNVPSTGTSYTANTAFGSGSNLGGGEYIVYSGSGTSVTITGLTVGTAYHWAIFEYNSCGNTYKTDASEIGNQTTLCLEPVTDASASSASGILTNQMQISWTSGSGTNRLVLVKEGAPVDSDPVDLATYTANTTFESGDQIGTGNYVVYSGVGNSVTVTNLNPGTAYYWKIYEFNSCVYDYKTDAPEDGNAITCTTPTAAASGSTTSNVGQTSFQLDWTNGDGDERMVVLRQSSAVTANPSDGTNYTANSAFGSGTAVSSGQYVVYKGNGTSVTITGLTWGTTYHWEIFEYNTCGPSFKTDATEIGNVTTVCPEPTANPTSSSATGVTGSGFTINWSGGDGTNSLVVVKQGSAVTASPADAASYSASTTFGSGTDLGTGEYVVYAGAGASVTISGLDGGGTVYHWAIYEFNNCEPDYLQTAPQTGSQSTLKYFYSTAAGNLNDLATWVSKSDGSGGTNPTNFTDDDQYFYIQNRTSATLGANWTVSGANSEVIVTSSVTTGFTIPSGSSLTGSVDVQNSGVLIIDNATNPTIGTLGASSTVVYSTNSASIVTMAYTGNLTISKALSLSGDVSVAGTLTLNQTLSINGNTLSLSGTVAGASTFIGSATSNLSITGTGSLGTIAFNQTATDRLLNNFTLNRTSSGTVTMGSRMDIGGVMTLTNGNLVLNNQNLVFASGSISQTSGRITGSAASTAVVLINGSGSFGTIYFDQTSAATRTIARLVHSRTGVTVTLGTNLNLYNNSSALQASSNSNYINLNGNTVTMETGAGFNLTGYLTGSSSSSIVITGTGSIGTLRMDQTSASTRSLSQLSLDRAGQTLTLANALDVATLTVTNGIVSTGFNLTVSSGISNAGTITQTAGTTTFSGTTSLSGAGTTTLYNYTNSSGTHTGSSGTVAVSGAMDNDGTYAGNSGTLNVAGNVDNSGTFTMGSVLNITGDLINSGTFTNGSGTLTVNDWTNSSTYNANSGAINVSGIWTNNGTFTSSTETVTFNGSGAQTFAGASSNTFYNMTLNNSNGLDVSGGGGVTIVGTLDVDAGTLTSGGEITLQSNASGTARIANLTGVATPFSGNFNVQRYLNENGPTWYLFAAATTSGTLEDLDPELYITGFTGTDDDDYWFKSVYSYTESGCEASGYTVPASSGVGFQNGSATSGWLIYHGNNVVADYTGTLRSGSVTISGLTRSGGCVDGTDQGFHLIGNPYASPIDWAQVLANTGNENIDPAMYTVNSAGSYVTNSGSGTIASGEAFWIEAATAGTSITFEENDKTGGADTYNNRLVAPETELLVGLKVGSYTDVPARLAFKDGKTLNRDRGDGVKIANVNNLQNIGLVTPDGKTLGYNQTADTSAVVIPIRVWTQYPSNVNKTYKITFGNVAEFTNNNRCLTLEDRKTGIFTPITSDASYYSVTMRDTTYTPRFFLHLSSPIAIASTEIGCGNPAAIVAEGEGSGPFNYYWMNSSNDTIQSTLGISSADTLTGITTGGTYKVSVTNNGSCGTIGASVVIDSSEYNTANANSLLSFNVTSASADLQWSASSSCVDKAVVRYRESGAASWKYLNLQPYASTTSLSGLLPGVTYEWRVQLFNGSNSPRISNVGYFTTLCNDAPTIARNLSSTVTEDGDISATLSWEKPGSCPITVTTVRYRATGALGWKFASVTGDSTSVTVTNLSANTDYEWRVLLKNGNYNSKLSRYAYFSTGNDARIGNASESETEPIESTADILIYPNPFSNSFTLALEPGMIGHTLEVRDMLGRLAIQTRLTNEIQSMDGSHLDKGSYLYVITDPTGIPVATGKLLKQ